MGNIISYVKTNGAQSFKDIPLGCVDSLVLSELAYNKYEGRVSGDMRFDVTLRELNSHGAADSLFSTTRVPEQNRVLNLPPKAGVFRKSLSAHTGRILTRSLKSNLPQLHIVWTKTCFT